MDSMANGLSRKLASEFGPNQATVPWKWVIFPWMTLVLLGLSPEVTILFSLDKIGVHFRHKHFQF